jgi:hypothetical protein
MELNNWILIVLFVYWLHFDQPFAPDLSITDHSAAKWEEFVCSVLFCSICCSYLLVVMICITYYFSLAFAQHRCCNVANDHTGLHDYSTFFLITHTVHNRRNTLLNLPSTLANLSPSQLTVMCICLCWSVQPHHVNAPLLSYYHLNTAPATTPYQPTLSLTSSLPHINFMYMTRVVDHYPYYCCHVHNLWTTHVLPMSTSPLSPCY